VSPAVAPQAPPEAPPRPHFVIEAGQRLVLDNVDWPAYEAIGEALLNRANIRLTYDRGSLEIMTLSPEHERLKVLLGCCVLVLADETGVRLGGFGSTTYKSELIKRGLEPDQCYYHKNLARMRGVKRLDLTRDPPPDVAIEIDVTNSSVNRMDLYAKLGVPELWRFEDEKLRVYQLAADRYEPIDHSPTFPNVPVGDLVPFLAIGLNEDDTTMIRAVRAWVRDLPARS
jgi:Uma2 family endonuclease